MKFFIEKYKDVGHRVTINIPKTIINNSLLKEFIKIRKTKNINGFRKGKVPITFIQKEYGNTIYYDIFKELMQKFFYEFLNKKQIKIIGSPKYFIHENKNQKKEHYEYSVIYSIYPKFEIHDIKNIKVEKIDVQIKDTDVQNNIEKYKFQTSMWQEVNRPIKSNDRVTINYCIYEKNNLIKKFSKKNFIFILSHNTLITELKYKIINHVINDTFFFKIKIHESYPEKELQNKDITCKIKIVHIEEKQEKNKRKINKKNILENTLQAVDYLNIKKNLNSNINQITEQYLESQIIEEIIKKNIILIPPLLFEEEKKNIYKQYKTQYQKEHAHILEKKYHYNIDKKVKKRLYMQIILDKIISDYEIFLNEEYIQSLITKISLNYQKPKEIIRLYNNNENFKNTIKNIELKNQAMNILKKRINIIQKSWNFDYFINYNWEVHDDLVF